MIFSGIDEENSGPKEYFAAVVEYHTVGEDDRISLRDLMLKNVDEYELLIKNASRLVSGVFTMTKLPDDYHSSQVKGWILLTHEIHFKQKT